MAANNYFGFTSGGTQYGASPSYQTGQAAAAYTIQHAPAANPQPYAAAPRPSAPATYEAAPAYQQPAHSNTSYPYAATAAAAPVRQPTTYDQKPQTYYQQATAAPAASTPAYSTTETAHYQSPYIQQQQQQQPQQQQSSTISTLSSNKVQSNSWQGGFRKAGNFNKAGTGGFRPKIPPKPQQLHYCEVCKVSCAGPQTYQEHLEGQKHKKKEIAAKSSNQALPRGSGISLRCELCDVTCTGNDAYTAHIRGIKHQKVVKLHTRLGKPIPATDPVVVSDSKNEKKEGTSPSKVNVAGKSEGGKDDKDDVQPVGQDYIEEIKNDDGKVINFLCKLCDCHFNDPNAKEMHMKGRRHRLQYKKKVNPELVVDIKPSLRHRKIQEERLRRHLQEEFWKRKEEEHWREEMRHMEEQERLYWEDRRRYEEYEWHRRFGPQGPGPHPLMRPGMIPPPGLLGRGFPPGPPLPALRKPESSDDRHVLSKHTQIYPKEEELNLIQKNVTNVEKALKLVSDIISCDPDQETEEKKEDKTPPAEGQNGESSNRILKGVMRVGMLAKGLLLTGDTNVQLVVMCSEKPTRELLEKVASLLPKQLTAVTEEIKYKVFPEKNSITVRQADDGKVDITINLTSPLMREANLTQPEEGKSEAPPAQDPPDVLDRQKCLEALAALRHAKWFQARASGLQSCVLIIRVMRDLCQRVPTWAHLSQWAMELLVEKVLSSAGQPLTPGEALRHVLEAIASGLLLPGGPGLLDPCEKEPVDAAANLTNQEREDITASAQHALRLFAFRQVHKVLGIDPLPPPKHGYNQFPRKRRRDGTIEEGTDGKKGKTDEVTIKMENSTEDINA